MFFTKKFTKIYISIFIFKANKFFITSIIKQYFKTQIKQPIAVSVLKNKYRVIYWSFVNNGCKKG